MIQAMALDVITARRSTSAKDEFRQKTQRHTNSFPVGILEARSECFKLDNASDNAIGLNIEKSPEQSSAKTRTWIVRII